MAYVKDQVIIAQWLREHLTKMCPSKQSLESFLEEATDGELFDLMDDFVDRFEDFDIIQDKLDKESIEEEAIENYDHSKWCLAEFGYDEDDLHQITDIFETDLEKATLEYDITIPISGDHWIEFPTREGSEAMMKLVKKLLPFGSLWIDLKKRLVFVPIADYWMD